MYELLKSDFEKLCERYMVNKKKMSYLIHENDELKSKSVVCTCESELTQLKSKNEELNNEVNNLRRILAKFTLGRDALDKLLGKQRMVFDKAGLGYKQNTKQKSYSTYFVKASNQVKSSIVCDYCCRKGHHIKKCSIRNKTYKGPKLVWVPKGTKVDIGVPQIMTNIYGPKVKWVPK